MANYKNIQKLLPANDNRTFGKMNWQYVTIHNTANRMPAKNEVSYVHSRQGEVTYHFAIDDKECIQLLPLTKSAWHAGDGRGNGNTKSVAIEICYSLDKGDKRYPIAEDNAAHKAAELLYSKGFGVDRLRKHQDWSGKYCPHRMLDNNGWEPFKRKVSKYLSSLDKPNYKTSTPISNQKPTVSVEQMKEWARVRGADKLFIDLAPTFYEVAVGRKLDPALLYAQSAKETNFMKFGGVLDKSFKNPCGMKTTKGGGNYDKNAHERFRTWEKGIKAQADHLNLYAGAKGYPMKDSPDPRHFPEIKGKAPTVEELGGNWAGAYNYGTSIVERMEEMRAIKTKEPKPEDSKTEENKKNRFKYAICYVNDGDLANAQALLNVASSNAILIKTSNGEDLNVDKVIQVGGAKVRGADIVLKGENRKLTLEEISKWINSL